MMSAIRCCELIRYANSSLPRRVEYLNEFLVKFDTLKLLLRVCRDRKLINIQTTADIIEMVTSVEKQILGWRNFTASQEEKAASVKPGSCSSRWAWASNLIYLLGIPPVMNRERLRQWMLNPRTVGTWTWTTATWTRTTRLTQAGFVPFPQQINRSMTYPYLQLLRHTMTVAGKSAILATALSFLSIMTQS